MLTHGAKISKVAPKWLRVESRRAGRGRRSPPALATGPTPHLHWGAEWRHWVPGGGWARLLELAGLLSLHNVLSVQCLVSLGLPLARHSLLPLPPDLHLPANPSSYAQHSMRDPIQGSPPPPLEPLFSRLPWKVEITNSPAPALGQALQPSETTSPSSWLSSSPSLAHFPGQNTDAG